MADLPVTPLADYGSLLSSLPVAQSQIRTQATQQQLTQAQIPLVGAQTQGIQYQNQKMQAQLAILEQAQRVMSGPVVNNQYPQYQGAPNPLPPASEHPQAQLSPQGEEPSTMADMGLDPQSIMSHAQQQYQVKDTWTPQENKMMEAAGLMEMAGLPNATANVQARHNNRITSEVNR